MMRSFVVVWLVSLTVATMADVLTVTVLARETDSPLAGALVQIGEAPDDPFGGNYSLTSAEGTVSFSDPRLVAGLPLTAAADGYANITVFDCPTGAITVWCDHAAREAWPDTSLISGVVTNLPVVDNDDSLDIAIVFPAASLEKMLTGQWSIFSPFTDTISVGPFGDVGIPENVDIPYQTEYWIVHLFKEPYKLRLRSGDVRDMLCLGYRMSLADMISGEGPTIGTKTTVERNYAVSGDTTVNHDCTIDFLNNIHVTVSNLPEASEGLALTLGELSLCPRKDKFFPLNQAGCRSETDTPVTLPMLPPTGPFSDVLTYAGVIYSDTSDVAEWGGGAFDWIPLDPWESRSFDSFYDPPEIRRVGHTFSFSNYQTPGTPQADFVLCLFALQEQSAAQNDTLAWEMVVPGSWDSFTVPELPTSSPGWDSLPDPSQTETDDQLKWGCYVVSTPSVLQEFLASPLQQGELFSFRRSNAPPLWGPDSLAIESVSQTDLELDWNPEEMADTYIIQWFHTPWSPIIGEIETDQTEFSDPGALPNPGSQRYYRLISHSGVSYSEPTDPLGGISWELDDGP